MAIVVGTERGLFAVQDDGSVRPTGLEDRPVTWLAGPTHALADGRTVERIAPGSAAESLAELPPGVTGRCLVVLDGDLLVGTSEAGLYRVRGGAAERVVAFDAVEGRDGWYTPWGGPPDTRSLARGADGALYANVHVGGIPRSRDGGEAWEPTIDPDADVHQVVTHPNDAGLVLAATAFGLAVSRDGGESWDTWSDGLETGRYQRAVAIAGDHAVVSAAEGHLGRTCAIHRVPLSGGAFERCAGLPGFGSNVDTGWIAADAAASGTVAFAGPDGTVWRSDDAGATWVRVAEGLTEPTSVALLAG